MSKNVLIIGCSGGMGSATARKFIKEGFNVFGLDIKNDLSIEGINYVYCDVTSKESIVAAFDVIKTKIASLYCIISTCGVYMMDSLLEIDDNRLLKIIEINALGIMKVIKTFYPLLTSESKVLITTSEVAPLDPLPFNGIYSISKALLSKYIFSLRMELNLFNIKIIEFRPGAVETDLLGCSYLEMNKFCENTVIHKNASRRFKKIVDSVESKSIKTSRIADKIYKIINKKHNKYVYRINCNKGLKLLNLLPDKLQVRIISSLLKNK